MRKMRKIRQNINVVNLTRLLGAYDSLTVSATVYDRSPQNKHFSEWSVDFDRAAISSLNLVRFDRMRAPMQTFNPSCGDRYCFGLDIQWILYAHAGFFELSLCVFSSVNQSVLVLRAARMSESVLGNALSLSLKRTSSCVCCSLSLSTKDEGTRGALWAPFGLAELYDQRSLAVDYRHRVSMLRLRLSRLELDHTIISLHPHLLMFP